MAVIVINQFEVIDIDKQHLPDLSVLLSFFPVQNVVKIQTAVKPGKTIVAPVPVSLGVQFPCLIHLLAELVSLPFFMLLHFFGNIHTINDALNMIV